MTIIWGGVECEVDGLECSVCGRPLTEETIGELRTYCALCCDCKATLDAWQTMPDILR